MSIRVLVGKTDKYNFWRLHCDGAVLWNITPVDQRGPVSGYPTKKYIEKIKGVTFPESISYLDLQGQRSRDIMSGAVMGNLADIDEDF